MSHHPRLGEGESRCICSMQVERRSICLSVMFAESQSNDVPISPMCKTITKCFGLVEEGCCQKNIVGARSGIIHLQPLMNAHWRVMMENDCTEPEWIGQDSPGLECWS